MSRTGLRLYERHTLAELTAMHVKQLGVHYDHIYLAREAA